MLITKQPEILTSYSDTTRAGHSHGNQIREHSSICDLYQAQELELKSRSSTSKAGIHRSCIMSMTRTQPLPIATDTTSSRQSSTGFMGCIHRLQEDGLPGRLIFEQLQLVKSLSNTKYIQSRRLDKELALETYRDVAADIHEQH